MLRVFKSAGGIIDVDIVKVKNSWLPVMRFDVGPRNVKQLFVLLQIINYFDS